MGEMIYRGEQRWRLYARRIAWGALSTAIHDTERQECQRIVAFAKQHGILTPAQQIYIDRLVKHYRPPELEWQELPRNRFTKLAGEDILKAEKLVRPS